MIASLPMYWRPELVGAHARLWALIRRGLEQAGIESPAELSSVGDEFTAWCDPSLVLGQTCGMPYRNTLHGRVTLIGTPDYGLDRCDPGFYRSAIIVRDDDPRERVEDFAGAVLAYNQSDSQSGYGAAYHHVAPLGFWFDRRVRSGAHIASAAAVADGRADIAAIDAVTWRAIERYEPVADSLRVIDWTAQTPGLPYISRLGADAGAIFAAVEQAIADLGTIDRRDLGIGGLVRIPAEAYLSVENPPPEVTAEL
ncbi:MAG: phosphate/phosphite/phosphonate ABC transporter substrate-binding protein [Acidimicrobiales bacterium]